MGTIRHQLANGCRLLMRPTPDKQILSIVANVSWGGRDDHPERQGETGMMARLLTKGTKKRTSLDIAEEMESIGGSLDAFCDSDRLGLETQTTEDDWEEALDILTDGLFNSTFLPGEFEKERVVARAELYRAEDNKAAYASKMFRRLFYRDHPYAWSPDGELESIDHLNPHVMPDLHQRVVRPDNILLTVVGNVPLQAFVDWLEKNWPAAPGNTPPFRLKPAAKPGLGCGEQVEEERNFEQGFIIAGYPVPLPGDPDSAPLRLLCGVLGEGMASRLFARLRDRDHLAYQVGAALRTRELGGYLATLIGTGPDTVDVALEGLLRESHSFAKEPAQTEEIERARRYILGKFLVGRQTNSAIAHSMSVAEMGGLGWEWVEAFPERIQAVQAEDLERVFEKYLRQPAIAVLRPKPQPEPELPEPEPDVFPLL